MFFSKKEKLTILFVTIALAAAFSFGFFLGEKSVICENHSQENANLENTDFSLFWEALNVLKSHYINPEKITDQNIIYGVISGMVNSLKDPYTAFMDPEESKKFLEDVSGEFEGVGMEIGIRKDQLQVIAPLKGTPAQKAGILPGDKIIKINGEYTSNMTLEEAVTKIRGKEGTKVTLTIMREGWKEPKDFEITRAKIEIPTIEWEVKNQNIAYIKIYQFSSNVEYEFRKVAIKIISDPKIDRMILDLRDNPGGYLESSQQIAGWFLKLGDVVTIEDFGGKDKNKEFKAYGNSAFLHYPVVVLINKGSASASEILAAALRDNRGIKLIGEKSFGKGSVQQLYTLSDGSNLKITIARWLTPKGKTIEGKGLDPDIEVEMTEEDYSQGKDPQLEKAIKVIESL